MTSENAAVKYRSARLQQLGSAIFAEVAQWKQEAKAAGKDIIDLGIGSPDQPPSAFIRQTIHNAALRDDLYGYASSEGTLAFRQAVADWFAYRFQVKLDPEREIISLMGSQDGLAHLALAVTNPGDYALVPDPGYPIYAAGLALAGALPYPMKLEASHHYLPRFEDIPTEVARKAKYMLLNYPSNPLSAVADVSFFAEAVHFAKEFDLLLVHDAAYSEMAFDGFRPPSIFEVEGAKELAVEFHSFSKSFNMAGCRLAFMAGNADAVQSLKLLKSNIDYGVFHVVQEAGIAALRENMKNIRKHSSLYEKRRDAFVDTLHTYGWPVAKPKATMFVWAPIPEGYTSRQISREMLQETGVVVIPGDAFGEAGEGYVRIALVEPTDKLQEAAKRIGQFISKLI